MVLEFVRDFTLAIRKQAFPAADFPTADVTQCDWNVIRSSRSVPMTTLVALLRSRGELGIDEAAVHQSLAVGMTAMGFTSVQKGAAFTWTA